jgi:hypothetical protein
MSLGIRSRVTVPLKFADGYRTSAEVITFDGLADGKEAPGARPRRRVRCRGAARAPALPSASPVTCRLRALRLRPAAARGGRADRRRRRLPALPAPGGPGHRALRQARRVRAAGPGHGHVRGEPGARARRRRAGLHRRGADADRAGRGRRRPAHQQPGQAAQLRSYGVEVRDVVPTACTPPPPTCGTCRPRSRTPRTPSTCRWRSDSGFPLSHFSGAPNGSAKCRRARR